MYNFHSHTQFCDGHDLMEEFVKEAVAQGFNHYGFSPHAPVPFESPCNMSKDDVPAYLAEAARLREIYGDRISLYSSMEIDYTDVCGPADEYFSQLPLDYRIGSIHFLPSFVNPGEFVDIDGRFPNFKKRMALHFNNDIEAVVRSYFNQSLKMVEAGGFDIIGHFDKIGFNASLFQPNLDEEPWYDRLVMQLFEAIMDHHYIIEVNTKAWQMNNRFFPNLKYFGMLKKYNAPVVVNSDAHYPTLINNGRPAALQLLDLL